jgi:ferredoxin
MKVVVDKLRCDGNGMCADACPEVFELGDDDDVVTVLTNEPDDALLEQVILAVRMCPKAVITIRD